MTTIFEEEPEEESRSRWARETEEVDEPMEGEVIPPGQQTEAPGEAGPSILEKFITEELCGTLFALPGVLQAKRTGHEWWRLEEEEKQLVGEATQPLILHLVQTYLGESIGMYGMALGALAAVYGPRQLREKLAEDEPEKPQKTPPASMTDEEMENDFPEDFGRTRPPSKAASPSSSANGAVASQSSNSEWQSPFQES